MSKRTLPVAKVGTRKGEAPARHRGGSHLQRVGFLYHRLSKRFVQRSGEKGVARDAKGRRKATHAKRGSCEKCFTCFDKKTGKRIYRVILEYGRLGALPATLKLGRANAFAGSPKIGDRRFALAPCEIRRSIKSKNQQLTAGLTDSPSPEGLVIGQPASPWSRSKARIAARVWGPKTPSIAPR